MAQGFKTGGRQKGTLNKNRGALLAKLEDSFPSYDPLLALIEIAHNPATELSMRVDCHKTLAGYIYPKMRTVGPDIARCRLGAEMIDSLGKPGLIFMGGGQQRI